jgi:hypothetical protein
MVSHKVAAIQSAYEAVSSFTTEVERPGCFGFTRSQTPAHLEKELRKCGDALSKVIREERTRINRINESKGDSHEKRLTLESSIKCRQAAQIFASARTTYYELIPEELELSPKQFEAEVHIRRVNSPEIQARISVPEREAPRNKSEMKEYASNLADCIETHSAATFLSLNSQKMGDLCRDHDDVVKKEVVDVFAKAEAGMVTFLCALVLAKKEPHEQDQMIRVLFKTAKKCKERRNFAGYQQVILALSTIGTRRVSQVEPRLEVKLREMYESDLSDAGSLAYHYQFPCIPKFDTFLAVIERHGTNNEYVWDFLGKSLKNQEGLEEVAGKCKAFQENVAKCNLPESRNLVDALRVKRGMLRINTETSIATGHAGSPPPGGSDSVHGFEGLEEASTS